MNALNTIRQDFDKTNIKQKEKEKENTKCYKIKYKRN